VDEQHRRAVGRSRRRRVYVELEVAPAALAEDDAALYRDPARFVRHFRTSLYLS